MSGYGKIHRLPFAVRKELNRRMREQQPDPEILAWLNGLPEVRAALAGLSLGGRHKTKPQVSAANLSEYRAGAYAAWLKEEERVERVKGLSEFALRMAEAAGGDVSTPAVGIAAGRLMEALEAATEEDLVKMAGALSGLSAAETAAVRARTDRDRLAVQARNLDLEERKFQRQTAALFLAWREDKRAEEIAAGKDSKEIKMDRLIELMFGRRPAAGSPLAGDAGKPPAGDVGSPLAGGVDRPRADEGAHE